MTFEAKILSGLPPPDEEAKVVPLDVARIAKLLAMLTSSNDNEKLAACNALNRALAASGTSLVELAATMMEALDKPTSDRSQRPAGYWWPGDNESREDWLKRTEEREHAEDEAEWRARSAKHAEREREVEEAHRRECAELARKIRTVQQRMTWTYVHMSNDDLAVAERQRMQEAIDARQAELRALRQEQAQPRQAQPRLEQAEQVRQEQTEQARQQQAEQARQKEEAQERAAEWRHKREAAEQAWEEQKAAATARRGQRRREFNQLQLELRRLLAQHNEAALARFAHYRVSPEWQTLAALRARFDRLPRYIRDALTTEDRLVGTGNLMWWLRVK